MIKGKLFLLPYPPPFAGPEIIAKAILKSNTLLSRKDVIHLNSNIRKSNSKKGEFDIYGVLTFLKLYILFVYHLLKTNTVFMYLCSSKVGFLRDSIYIITCWVFRKNCIAQYHGANFKNFYKNQSVFYRSWIRFSLNRLSNLIVLGDSLKELFSDCYKGNLDVLYNGLSQNEFNPKQNYDNSPFTIFFMGHLSYSKGFYDLVDAYKILHRKYGESVRLLFAGENFGFIKETGSFLNGKWKIDFLKNGKIKNREIQEFIKNSKEWNSQYLGFVTGDEKYEVLKKSNLFVLPSYTEGFSMACLEAMAVGLPVITTPVGAMKEIVKHKQNGLITEIGKPKMLSIDIEYFIKHRDEAERIGKYNTTYVRENFGIERVAKKLIKILTYAK